MEALTLLYKVVSLCVALAIVFAVWQLIVAIADGKTDRRIACMRRLGMFAGAALILALMARAGSLKTLRSPETLVSAGDIVRPFAIQTIDGESLSIPAADQIILVNFFATWCGPCRAELPYLQKIWEENQKDKRFKIVVVGQDETKEEIVDFCEELGLTLPFATEQRGSIYSQFASEGIPRTLVFDPKGKVLYSGLGFSEDEVEHLKVAVDDALLSLNTPSP